MCMCLKAGAINNIMLLFCFFKRKTAYERRISDGSSDVCSSDLLDVPRDPSHGPDSADWLGVPMRREGRVSGAIVVQSYLQAARYTHEDRTLLEYVAQHILTALDRRQAREQLERRVDARTRELQQANMVLQAEIIERQHAEKLQRETGGGPGRERGGQEGWK